MQDPESQSDVNPGIVEQRLDDAAVEREGVQESGGVEREGTQGGDVEREGLRGGPVTERERPDGAQVPQREALDERGQAGREDMMHGARRAGTENTPGRGDPIPPAGGSSR